MRGFHHLALACRDRAAQQAFYAGAFGFQPVHVFKRGEPGEFVMLRLGGACLELFPARGPGTAQGAGQPVGFLHFAIEVDRLEPVLERVRAAGVEPGEILDASAHVPGLRLCFFNDPEGNRVEIMEGWKDDPA